MSTATMTSKGQIELVATTRSVKALKGLVNKPASPVTIEQMNEAMQFKGRKRKVGQLTTI